MTALCFLGRGCCEDEAERLGALVGERASRVDAVFVGDALTTRHVLTGRVGPQPTPFTDAPDDARESLQRLAAVRASWVLPGHGAPWHGSPAEIAEAVKAFA
jgi:glyoxylase-like metal-dependent hydrolase (beta-lactamase superfamily II)